MLNINDFTQLLSSGNNGTSLDLSNCTLLECLDKKIEIRQRYSPRCGKQYHSLRKSLTEIENATNMHFYPVHINEKFWSLFIPFLERQGKEYSTIKTICSQITALLQWASKYKVMMSESFNEYHLPSFEKFHIALTPDDVSRVYHLNIDMLDVRPQHKRTLCKVRDMFCLMCNLGLRYSDARRLTKDHFKDGTLSILQQKTKRYAHVDINRLCIHKAMTYEILERYDYSAPYSCDGTEFDKLIHELMEYCDFRENIQQETILGGVVISASKEKCKMITSHTGRRTFVVNNALKGIPPLDIMRATGHKTFSAFQKYLCYS